MRRYRVRRKAAGLRSTVSWAPRSLRAQVLAKADLIRTLAKAHGAASIDLFGSAARGDDRPGSDLDFIVELEPGRTLLDLIGLANDLEAALGTKVDAATRAGLKPKVLAAAERDAIRIL